MPKSKNCTKDLDTGKCRKVKKSGRPRCSGRTPECIIDASNKYCKKQVAKKLRVPPNTHYKM